MPGLPVSDKPTKDRDAAPNAVFSFLYRNRYILTTTTLLASLAAAAMAVVCVLFPPTLLLTVFGS